MSHQHPNGWECVTAGKMLICTEHFHPREFDCKDGTPYPAAWYVERLARLLAMLETIRAAAGAPVTILSGFRTPAWNAKKGGARQSQHMLGRAADITIAGLHADDVHALVMKLYMDGTIDRQLGGLGKYPSFTHVDIRPVQALCTWDGNRKSAEV